MILCEPERVGGGEVCNVWVAVGLQVLRSRQHALQQAIVTDAGWPTMFGKLPLVGVEDLGLGQPAWIRRGGLL